MNRVIVVTPDKLRAIIEDVVRKEYQPKAKEAVVSDNLSLTDAIAFLRESGLPTSKAKIYKLTSNNRMPYSKYGNKLVFSRKALQEWANKQIVNVTDDTDSILETVKSAHRMQKKP